MASHMLVMVWIMSQFSVNVWIRPLGKKFTEEERMIFELKFANKFPIKNLQKYMEDLFK